MSVSREDKVSAIITDWIETMSYLTGPDKLPMLDAVSNYSTEGICIRSIKENVQNAKYSSLQEFVVEFEKLVKFERFILNSTKNSEIETIKEIEQISEESLNQVLAIYKIYILEEYLGNWISKTQAKVEDNTTTVDKLYETIIRGKVNMNIQQPASSIQRKMPEEKPERISKRLSALKRKLATGTETETTCETPSSQNNFESEPTSSQETPVESSAGENTDSYLLAKKKNSKSQNRDSIGIEDKPSLQELEHLSIEPDNAVSQSSGKIIGFDKKPGKAFVQISPMKKRFRSSEVKGSLIQKKLKNVKNVSLKMNASPLIDDLSTESDNSQIATPPPPPPTTTTKSKLFPNNRRRRIVFTFLKKRRAYNINRTLNKNKHNKTTEKVNSNNTQLAIPPLNRNESIFVKQEQITEIETTLYNNNNNDNINNNNNIDVPATEQQQPTSTPVKTEPITHNTEYVITRPADHQSLRINVERASKAMHSTDTLIAAMQSFPPPASVAFHSTRSVAADYRPPQVFPRYPYSSCPSASPSPFSGFYSRQKVPTFREQYPLSYGAPDPATPTVPTSKY